MSLVLACEWGKPKKKKINVNSFATVLIHAVKNSLILWFVKNAEYLKNPKYTN